MDKKFGITVKEFITLSQDKQADWIENNIPDYDMNCYGDGYLGAFYPIEIDLKEFLDDRDAYGVAGLISSQDPEVSDERIEQIDAGHELTEKELHNLLTAIAEADVDSWLTHNSFEIQLLDGSVHAYFVGHSLGPGGYDFKYSTSFETYKKMLETISKEPMSYIE